MVNHIYTTRTMCRVCNGSPLEDVWNLGLQYIYSLEHNNAAPLVLTKCTACGLIQSRHTVDPDVLYGHEYYYQSGINDTMRGALADVVQQAMIRQPLDDGDAVLDIGSNDGTLLSNYPRKYKTIGFEPSNLARGANKYMHTQIYNRYFESGRYDVSAYGPPKIITACAMFYDLDDPHRFLEDVRWLMDADGLLIIQMNYLHSMINGFAFDNISAEHLCYYSIKDMENLLDLHGMEIQDLSLNDVNGGSMRYYIRRRAADKKWEKGGGYEYYKRAEENITSHAGIETLLTNMIYKVDKNGDTIRRVLAGAGTSCAVGASTRGYVMLQYWGLDKYIETIIDRNPDKVGKYLGNFKIDGEFALNGSTYDKALILPYFFKDEIMKRKVGFKGQYIVPLPDVQTFPPSD